MRFELGRVIVTPKASEALRRDGGLTLGDLLRRHQSGDWGDVSEETAKVNEQALSDKFALVSAYDMPAGERVTIFTRPDRSYTLVHMSQETQPDLT